MAEEKSALRDLTKSETELIAGASANSQIIVTGKRVVKLPPKALFLRSSLEKERKAKLGALSKIKESIAELISDKKNEKKVESTFQLYKYMCDQAQQVHNTLLGLLPFDQAEEHEIWYRAKLLNVHLFITGTNQWLSVNRRDDDDDGGGGVCGTKHNDSQIEMVQSQASTAQPRNQLPHTEIQTAGQMQTNSVENENVNDGVVPDDSISNVETNHNGSRTTKSSTSSEQRKIEA